MAVNNSNITNINPVSLAQGKFINEISATNPRLDQNGREDMVSNIAAPKLSPENNKNNLKLNLFENLQMTESKKDISLI